MNILWGSYWTVLLLKRKGFKVRTKNYDSRFAPGSERVEQFDCAFDKSCSFFPFLQFESSSGNGCILLLYSVILSRTISRYHRRSTFRAFYSVHFVIYPPTFKIASPPFLLNEEEP